MAIGIPVVLLLLHAIRYDAALSTFVARHQLYKHERWDALLEKGKKAPSRDLRVQFMTNFALYEKERLLDEMFSYPYERDSTILVDWGMAYALQYHQAVEGVRTDLEVMPINLFRRYDYVLLKEILAGRRPRRIYHLSAIVGYPVTASRTLYVIRQPLSASTRTEADISLVKEAEGVVRVVADDPIPSRRLDRNIGSGVVLVGYEVRGEKLHLYWQASQPLDQDYGTFVRFFDDNGEPISQQDKPADDLEVLHMTTSEWEVGQTVRDVFALPEGAARIEIGMYRPEGGGIVPYGENTSLELDH